MTPEHSSPRACRNLAILALATIVLTPVYLGVFLLGRRARYAIARLWFRAARFAAGIEVRHHGIAARGWPLLFVANHVSYLDIPILGGLIDASFVAKEEVAGWPVLGLIARLGRTVFVRRASINVRVQRELLSDRLAAGDDLLLFPEGTSSDGSRVLPFKSALFSVVQESFRGSNPRVQPVSIAYPRLADGRVVTGELRSLHGWFGDRELMSHLWQVLGLPGVVAEVRFHEPIRAGQFASRKELARHCETVIADGLARSFAEASELALADAGGVASSPRPLFFRPARFCVRTGPASGDVESTPQPSAASR